MKNVIDQIRYQGPAIHYSGKVRENFTFENDQRAIVVTDRVSAFDFVLGTIPGKGQVLNNLAAWWFEMLDEIEIPHHLISVPHPNVSLVKNVTPLPVEFVVRAYLTGTTTTSSWFAYKNHDQKICDIAMPDGMTKNQKFPKTLFTPTTKPTEGHDVNISEKEIVAQGLMSAELLEKAKNYSLKMFQFGQMIADKQGLILVDTKYEMGITDDGELIVIDEVHTPDSSRYWVKATYEKRLNNNEEPDGLDKEFVRRMLVDEGYDPKSDDNPANYLTPKIQNAAASKYLELYERMTGEPLKVEDVSEDDIRDALKKLEI